MPKVANKKNTSKKPNTKSASKKKKKFKQPTIADIVFKKEVGSTLTFIAGIVLLILALFAGGDGSVWNTIHRIYFSLFGLCGYYIPFAVLFFGIVNVLNKQNTSQLAKSSEIMFLIVIVCSFLHVNNSADEAVSFFDSIKNVFIQSETLPLSSLENGGFIGAVLGGSVFQLCKSTVLSNVILAVLFVADIMLLFGISLLKVFVQMEKPARKVEDAIEKSKDELSRIRNERIEEKKTERAAEVSKKSAKSTEFSKVVKDFFNSDVSTSEDDIAEDDVLDFNEPSKSPEQQSIFDFTEIKTPSQPAKTVFPDDIIENNGFVQDETADKKNKTEKLEPLSEKEEKELKDSLDNAVNQQIEIEYVLPPLDCLNPPKPGNVMQSKEELQNNGERLIAALNSFNVSASIVGVVPGPTVTRYELAPAPGVKINKFTNLSDDLALHMAAPAGLRIEAPIPNKAAIGIEIPNSKKATVTFRESIDNSQFKNAESKLCVALGKDISGNPMFCDLAKMPHLLVAGTTGSGKSVCLNSMIVSILYNATPDEVKILLIDPKQVEFGVYNGLPHLLVPVVSDPRKAAGALGWAVTEMLRRYKILNENGVRDIAAYNSLCEANDDLEKMPQIVIFIDELADLMTVAPSEVEDSIQRLAQMARASGMHLVVATQRPSADVITGVIKSNIPSRIALTVKSYIDSKIIIDTAGAEKLMGYGDMLYYPVGVPKPVRIQGCYLSDKEIEKVVTFIKGSNSSDYSDDIQQEIERQAVKEKKKSEELAVSAADSNDDLLNRAIELFVSAPEKASISALQRHLGLGFAKAGRLMDTLEEKGIVGPHMGSKPRNVLITKAQWYEMSAMNSDVTDDSLQNFDSSDGDNG